VDPHIGTGEIKQTPGNQSVLARAGGADTRTFASHFMMNGGNILTLQRILAHANVTMTTRYAHMSPNHLEEAKNLNPLARLTLG
jgi:integrase